VPLPLPPDPPLAIDWALQERLDQAHLFLGRLDSLRSILPETPLFPYSYVRKEAVVSSQIEGTQSSLSDLLLYELDGAPGVPIDDAREVSCYVKALEAGLAGLRAGLPISTRLVLEMHRVMLSHGRDAARAPGEFRRAQNWLGGDRPSRAIFVPPPPQRVVECWSALERFLNDVPTRTTPLLKAALAHVQFETIHPFLDGNGRLGRLLIPLILVSERVLAEPLLYLSLHFSRHRQRYYDLLQLVRTEGDWETWLSFFADAVVETAQSAVATAQALSRIMRQDRQRAQQLGRIAGSALRVLDAMARRPLATAGHLEEETGLTAATVNKALSALAADGVAIVKELTGQKRNRVFAYSGYLAALNEDLAE
jgi:Fic family protein